MAYVNHLTLSLLAVTAVLLVGAWYVLVGEREEKNRKAHAFAAGAGGLVMALTGFHVVFTWPLPGQYNIAFGEPLAYFGSLLAVGGVALWRGAGLRPLAVLAAFGGAATLLVAVAIARNQLTWIPGTATVAFGATGLGALSFPLRERSRSLRIATAALLALAGTVFALITSFAYLHHLEPGSFDMWRPEPMRHPVASSFPGTR